MFTHAIVRKPGANFAQGITTANLGKPDFELMIHQHQAYTQALETLGLEVTVLQPDPDFPDAYFVEDVAVVIQEFAIITNPGAPARKGEQISIEPVLAQFRPIARIHPPGIVEGGDVLMVDRHLFIGISERTNLEGATQLGSILEHSGYTWTPIEVTAGLHLKSNVTYIENGILLVSGHYAKREGFDSYQKIVVPQDEKYAANAWWINDHLIMPLGFPQTKERLVTTGLPIIEQDVSEAHKMDGALTCMSLRIQ